MGKELASIDPTTEDGLANLATGGLSGQFNAVGSGLANIGDKIDDNLLGGNEADAAKEAARQQEEVGRLALQQQKEATEQIRGDLEPFRTLGSDSIPLLQGAVNDPSARVLSNPFFQAMAADQEQRLMASAAARGKLGSGGANDDLQRNLYYLAINSDSKTLQTWLTLLLLVQTQQHRQAQQHSKALQRRAVF